MCRSRRSPAPSGNLSLLARCATSACRKPRLAPSAGRTPCTRLPRCRASTPCGPATPNPRYCPPAPNSTSASCRSAPLGKGFLTGTVDRKNHFADGDIRATIPRFSEHNRDTNQALVDHVRALASARNATHRVRSPWPGYWPRTPRSCPSPEPAASAASTRTRTPHPCRCQPMTSPTSNALADRVQVHGNRYNDQHMAPRRTVTPDTAGGDRPGESGGHQACGGWAKNSGASCWPGPYHRACE